MTINKKISIALGSIIIVVAAGTAISQHVQSLHYSYTAPTTTTAIPGMTANTPTTTTNTVIKPKTANTPAKAPAANAPGTYTLADIALHNNGSSCWSAINGGVYDLTSWINQHPGGTGAILSICGKDGSSAFNAQHSGQSRPANELAGFKIGILATS